MAGVNDTLTLIIPSALVPTGATQTLQLTILPDRNRRRGIQRAYRDANASDPGRIRRVQWEVGGERVGAIGASLESTAGYLGVDFTRDIETRWDRRITSAIAETTVTLTGDDPPGTGAYFGTAYFGTSYFGSGSVGGQDVVVFDEQDEYLFAHRGQLSTQVDMSSWTVIDSHVQDAVVRDAEHWYGYGRIALGSTVPMQTRLGANSSGATYTDTTSTTPAADVYATAVKRGSDRAWIIDAAVGSTFNYANFTLDSFTVMSNPFQVGDPRSAVNGIGIFNGFTRFGSIDNIYVFTDQGKPSPQSKALNNLHSTINGSQWADPGFGWHYYISTVGLRAVSLSGVDNPVGIGERMRGFTGHNGLPTAIFAARGELWVVYKTSAGDLYGYRGVFGSETGGTGQPLFYPWFYAASQTCNAIFSSTTPNSGSQLATIVRGAGTNMTYMTIARDGRDDLASLTYSTGGGTAYLTTLDRDPNLLKTARVIRTRTRNITSGSSWAVALAFDANPTNPVGASYTTIGTITTNGAQTLTPVSGSAPLSNISGRTIKPRLTQVAGGSGASTSPPEIIGTVELEYEERPEQIEEITAAVSLQSAGWSNNQIWEVLRKLNGSTTDGPFALQLPDDLPPGVTTGSGGGQKYAMLAGVTQRQDTDAETEQAVITLHVWPQAVAL